MLEMGSSNVEIVEIIDDDDDDDDDGVLCFDGGSEKKPILLDVSDEEPCIMFPVGKLSSRDQRRGKRVVDLNVECIDVDSLEPCIMFPVGVVKSSKQRGKSVIDLNLECVDVEEECGPSSVVLSKSRAKRALDMNRGYVEDEVQLIDDLSPVAKRNRCETSNSRLDHDGDDLDSSIVFNTFKCEICVDDKPIHELFVIKGCNHHYCSECMTRYVASKLEDNIPHITCPVTGCKGVLDPEDCQEILPSRIFDRWGDALCELLFPASQKVYCPYKNCSGLLIDDCKRGKKVIKKSECLHCKRLFCFQCRTPWHEKMKCEEFQKLNKDGLEAEDVMLMKLAKSKKWQRCPKCKFYVQKNHGCQHMSCRCGHQFCYRCAVTWPQCNGSCMV